MGCFYTGLPNVALFNAVKLFASDNGIILNNAEQLSIAFFEYINIAKILN